MSQGHTNTQETASVGEVKNSLYTDHLDIKGLHIISFQKN